MVAEVAASYNLLHAISVHRPPVVDIMHFLEMEKSWILPALFGNKPIAKIAHGLAGKSKALFSQT